MQDDVNLSTTKTKQFRVVRHSHKQSDSSVRDFEDLISENLSTARMRKHEIPHFEASPMLYESAAYVSIDQISG